MRRQFHASRYRRGVAALAILFLLGSAGSAFAHAASPENFATANEAVNALVQALQTHDKAAFRKVLGADGEPLVSSGDAVADAAARDQFLAAYQAGHSLAAQPDGSLQLIVGENDWPMPIPLIHSAAGWQFDSAAGVQEIIDRRIGQDELLTIQTLLSAVDAQEDFFARKQQSTGAGYYAGRLLSTPGQQDGLYWAVDDGQTPSPLGPLIAQAEAQGYPGATAADGVQTPYQGYYFHLLKAQGPEAPDGPINYLHDGKLTGGFAYVAWPARYGNSGVMTFLVDQEGVVLQKDLGPDTGKIASNMSVFNPDVEWARVDLGN